MFWRPRAQSAAATQLQTPVAQRGSASRTSGAFRRRQLKMFWRPRQVVDTGPSLAVTLTTRVGSVDPATGPAAGLAAAVVLGPAMGNAAGLVAHGGSCDQTNLVEAAASALASRAPLAPGDSAVLASVLVADYGLTAQKDIGLLDKGDMDVNVNALGLRSISRKKSEAL